MSILTTKLYRPPTRPNAIIRSRLLERLNHGLIRKLTLLAAPAGYGKTTLISAWIAACARPAAWLSLDSEYNSIFRFLTYLIAALQTIRTDFGGALLAALQSPQPPQPETLLADLTNEIATFERPLIVVLDDYHAIDSDQIDRALTFLIQHLPPHAHLVIATREDPALPLAQLRARDQMNELRLDDLRFTPAEAAAFLTEAMELDLTRADIAALVARTEGWIAGLQLAALSLQGQPDIASFIMSFTGSHRYVIDYLVEETLNRQPAAIQHFLLRTAILDRLTGSLCDAVANDTSTRGQAALEALERANLFLVPLDDERRWYRYHHLFADVLRQRLRQHAAEPGDDAAYDITELHRRASIWYEQHNLTHDAFQHAVAAGEYERAADLAESAWLAMFRNSFQNMIFLGWMRALPDGLVRARPILSAGYAWALLDIGELESADIYLHDAERWLNERTNHTAGTVAANEAAFLALPAIIALARAYHASASEDPQTTIINVRRAIDLLPEHDRFGRAGAAALLGAACLREGDLDAAASAFTDGIALIQSIGNIAFALSGIPPLAGIYVTQGRLQDAIGLHQRMLRLATEQGAPFPAGTANLYAGLSEVFLEKGDIAIARDHLRHGEELGERAALPDWHYRLRCLQARFAEIDGMPDRALALLDEAEQWYYQGPLPDLRPVAALKARLLIRQGRLAEARQWTREHRITVDDTLTYIHAFEHVTLARLLIASARRDQDESALRAAENLLDRLYAAADAGGRIGEMIEIRALQALAAAEGDGSAALDLLKHALLLAQAEGYVRVFVDEGAPMLRLLSQLHERDGALHPYLHTLLAAFSAPQITDHASLSRQPLTEPLSQRELEVLRLVAQGLSNREIGERLHLAISTVKGHNLTIFGKLQVRRRTEAIVRARELGLL